MAYKDPEKLKAAGAAYYKANREKIKTRRAEYRKANPEKLKAAGAAYREANPEKTKARMAEWYKANREKEKAYKAEHRKANPEKVKATAEKYRKANPEKVKAWNAAWQKANPEKAKVHKLNRRAREAAAPGSCTKEDLCYMFEFWDYKCAVPDCDSNNLHTDHIIPLTAEGTSGWIWNLQPLCEYHNVSKGYKTKWNLQPLIDAERKRRLLLMGIIEDEDRLPSTNQLQMAYA